MHREEYLGQEMYIELCDDPIEGWSQAFFDEVVTYYETAPDYANMKDEEAAGPAAALIQSPAGCLPDRHAACLDREPH